MPDSDTLKVQLRRLLLLLNNPILFFLSQYPGHRGTGCFVIRRVSNFNSLKTNTLSGFDLFVMATFVIDTDSNTNKFVHYKLQNS